MSAEDQNLRGLVRAGRLQETCACPCPCFCFSKSDSLRTQVLNCYSRITKEKGKESPHDNNDATFPKCTWKMRILSRSGVMETLPTAKPESGLSESFMLGLHLMKVVGPSASALLST